MNFNPSPILGPKTKNQEMSSFSLGHPAYIFSQLTSKDSHLKATSSKCYAAHEEREQVEEVILEIISNLHPSVDILSSIPDAMCVLYTNSW